jgi:hypothetical protein
MAKCCHTVHRKWILISNPLIFIESFHLQTEAVQLKVQDASPTSVVRVLEVLEDLRSQSGCGGKWQFLQHEFTPMELSPRGEHTLLFRRMMRNRESSPLRGQSSPSGTNFTPRITFRPWGQY